MGSGEMRYLIGLDHFPHERYGRIHCECRQWFSRRLEWADHLALILGGREQGEGASPTRATVGGTDV